MSSFRINKTSEKDLLTLLQEMGVYLPAYCGGAGKCGKCKVRFITDAPPATEIDRSFISEEEILAGYRLACLVKTLGEFEIEIPDASKEDGIIAETGFSGKETNVSDAGFQKGDVIAVDIGTTTIAARLVNPVAGETKGTVTSVNHQRVFGADVITRIEASNAGKGEALKESIQNDLEALAAQLGADPDTRMFISANSTMEHLLQGLPCESLGVAPYTPVDISLHDYEGKRPMTILPGISTYVGADIVSGIIACDMDLQDDIHILVDLGTNGEMVIGNKNSLMAASTAAGPAFEGGNISCGVAGIPGAISGVEIIDGEPKVSTIADEKPIGLCGTGVLEVMYELLKEEYVDETGLLDEPYDEDGFPLGEGLFFTPKDVRAVQLAKSAIRTGIEVLINEYGTDYEHVAGIYLAGGFGQRIDFTKAVGIGLIPEELLGKIKAVGNSSLEGAVAFAKGEDRERFVRVASLTKEVSLAENPSFQDLYMDYMFFPE